MLWEPTRGLRRRLRGPEHDGPSGEGLDYCAVRERGSSPETCLHEFAKVLGTLVPYAKVTTSVTT